MCVRVLVCHCAQLYLSTKKIINHLHPKQLVDFFLTHTRLLFNQLCKYTRDMPVYFTYLSLLTCAVFVFACRITLKTHHPV